MGSWPKTLGPVPVLVAGFSKPSEKHVVPKEASCSNTAFSLLIFLILMIRLLVQKTVGGFNIFNPPPRRTRSSTETIIPFLWLKTTSMGNHQAATITSISIILVSETRLQYHRWFQKCHQHTFINKISSFFVRNPHLLAMKTPMKTPCPQPHPAAV